MISKVALRRERHLDALIEAAERRIAVQGVAGIKARELADEIGVAVGAIYNLVGDLDELVLRVGVRTMRRLDETLSHAVPTSAPATREEATNRLVAIAQAYRRFASENTLLWRSLFDHRMRPAPVPEWATGYQVHLFRHVHIPLEVLMPGAAQCDVDMMARTLFSATHGIVAFGLEDRLIAVPIDIQDAQLEKLVRLVCRGL